MRVARKPGVFSPSPGVRAWRVPGAVVGLFASGGEAEVLRCVRGEVFVVAHLDDLVDTALRDRVTGSVDRVGGHDFVPLPG